MTFNSSNPFNSFYFIDNEAYEREKPIFGNRDHRRARENPDPVGKV